jgi:hypothetical protein
MSKPQGLDSFTASASERIFGYDADNGAAPALASDIREPAATSRQSPAAAELSPAQLLMQFESLGDNCEFGLVQRYAGAEPLGLFRFSFEHMAELLAVLENRFESLKKPDAVEIFLAPENHEYMVRLNPHGFVYHTHIAAGTADPEVLRAKEIRRVAFLMDKLIDDLASGEKILIRKGEGIDGETEAFRLLDAARCYGPNTLLWVVTADDANPAGMVEVIGPHLLRGYISHFAPYDDAHNIVLPDWIDLCAGAYLLWKTEAPVGTHLGPARREPAPNLIDGTALTENGWRKQHDGETPVCPSPLRDDAVVMTHVLTTRTNFETGLVCAKLVDSGINADEIYTLSAWLFIPAKFRGTGVGMVFDAFPSLSVRNADLSVRDRWQLVWVSSRIPRETHTANPGLLVVGEAGDFVFSTSWKLEAGVVPTAGA